jgi:hypothetical protein
MNGGKYIPPNRTRLADDLLDKAKARETERLKDVLTRLRVARHWQKISGSIVLDGRKSVSKLPMVNLLFHCADGTWLIECVDTSDSDWRSEMEEDETKPEGDWIFHKAYANINCAKRNRLQVGPGRAAKLTCVQYNMRLRHAREDLTFEPECLPSMELDPIDAEADDFDESPSPSATQASFGY